MARNPIDLLRKALPILGKGAFNSVITYVPFHAVRLAALRLIGVSIGHGASVGIATKVLAPASLSIGANCSIGGRCLLDARGGIVIEDAVVLASDTHLITGEHLVDSDTFEARLRPIRIGDHAWLASRVTVLPGVTIARGAVVGACSLVRRDVGERDVVAGVPATVRGTRHAALTYNPHYRGLFE